jgi:hypothetical protein
MRLFWLALFIVGSIPPSSAQIADRAQKKDWVYLFKLSKDIKEVENCIYSGSPKDDKDKLWQIYHRKVRDYVMENDDYIKKYLALRGKTETEEDFRFRV